MTIKFCKKCNSLMKPFEGRKMRCIKCNFIEESKDLIEKEKIPHEEERAEGVVKDKNIFATYLHKCEKCGYDKAEVIDQGVKYTDEAGELLLKCGKCDWSERVNHKTS